MCAQHANKKLLTVAFPSLDTDLDDLWPHCMTQQGYPYAVNDFDVIVTRKAVINVAGSTWTVNGCLDWADCDLCMPTLWQCWPVLVNLYSNYDKCFAPRHGSSPFNEGTCSEYVTLTITCSEELVPFCESPLLCCKHTTMRFTDNRVDQSSEYHVHRLYM